MEEGQETQTEGEHSKSSHIVTVVAVVIVVLLLGLWFYNRTTDTGTNVNGEVTSEVAPGQMLTTALEGRVVSGFPEELLLEDNATVAESFSIEYSENGFRQPAVKYSSALPLDENIEMFGNYLDTAGWNHRGLQRLTGGVSYYYATRDNVDVNITFESSGLGMVDVTISYLEK